MSKLSLVEWGQLDKLATFEPQWLSESNWWELMSFATKMLNSDDIQMEYWQKKFNQYSQRRQLLRKEIEDRKSLKEAPSPIPVLRNKLITEFTEYYSTKYSEDGIPYLVDFLISVVGVDNLEKSKPDRKYIDEMWFCHVKRLVSGGMRLPKAMKKNDEVWKKPEGTTRVRFYRLTHRGKKQTLREAPDKFPELYSFMKEHS